MKKVVLYYTLFVLFALGFPIYLISTRYQVFESIQTPQVQVLGGFMIISIVVFFFAKSQIKDMVESMEESKLKNIVKSLVPVSIIFLLLIVVKIARVHLDNAEFILTWSLVSVIISRIFYIEYKSTYQKAKDEKVK